MTHPTPQTRETIRFRVSGHVQGVGFRWFVCRAAERLELAGDVANLGDGSVEVRAAGSRERLERLLGEVRRGPSGARVDAVEVLAAEPISDTRGFTVRR